ncbi:MAG TPA: hypothetical protein VEW03_12615 [Longimicrobiaceae bacterium]|nr:hypothetical protein [Longimicrobiaceae bacterium]
MERFFALFSTLLFFSFVACCVASALLQVIAWTRHAREGVRVDPRALWKPEGLFDAIGLFQMKLAKRALVIGAVMYLSYGVMMLLAGTVMKG